MKDYFARFLIGAALVFAYAQIPVHVCLADDTAKDMGHGYTRTGDHIYFKGKRIDQEGRHDIDRFAKAAGHPLKLCAGVDAANFVALSEEYSKDKNKVYYKWVSPGRFWVVELPDADPSTFKVLDFNLAKDAQRVWKGDQQIIGADASSAVVIRPHWTWKDRDRVYYQAVVIQGADPKTFRHLDQGFYKDVKRVYWCDEPLADADPDTFQTFGDETPYAKDHHHVWSDAKILKDVEAESFQLLHNHVYKDGKRVYAGTEGLEVLKADSPSFVKVVKLQEGGAVLFRDRSRHYLYDPAYNEIYALETKADATIVSKPVWRSDGARPSHAATVSAELKNGSLSSPEVTLQPGFDKLKPPIWEKEKLRRLKPAFEEARKQMLK